MKTSASQFDLMVTFMEQHGDLSKPTSNARGRLTNIKNWEDLTQSLNCDGTGDTKSTEKWKKVWSDFKNNTKRKAARLHRAATGTGGGPATFAKLSNLEQRVLNLIGAQVATGLMVEEPGLPKIINIQPSTSRSENLVVLVPPELVQCPQEPPETVGSPLPPQVRVVSSPPHTFIAEEVHSSLSWTEPGPSARPSFSEVHMGDTSIPSPSRPSSHVQESQPAPAQSTPRRARQMRPRGSPRRLVRPAHTEQAAQQFLQAEEYWRKFKTQQHKDYMDMRREQNRIREMEIQVQTQWQTVGLRALDLLEKLVNKYCKDN